MNLQRTVSSVLTVCLSPGDHPSQHPKETGSTIENAGRAIDAGDGSEMTHLYLDDLHIGQRFQSATYTMEVAKIKEFAAEYDMNS